MREVLIWEKLNKIIAAQKKLDTFLFEQKHIVADILIKMAFIESKLSIREGEFNDFKKDFVDRLQEYKKGLERSGLQSKNSGTAEGSCDDDGCILPGKQSH